jgi:penicillin-binding protein 1A
MERIQDRNGHTITRRDKRSCSECQGVLGVTKNVPRLIDHRQAVTDPATAFQVTWMLKGVVERGTGRRIRELGRPLAGKTGTTNESFDAWFIGFSPDLVAGVFVGFDKPRTLGVKQTGANVAAPIFKQFMELAIASKPPVPFRIPRGIRMVRIDAETGRLPGAGTKRTILEAFKPGTEPISSETMAPDSIGSPTAIREDSSTPESGLY